MTLNGGVVLVAGLGASVMWLAGYPGAAVVALAASALLLLTAGWRIAVSGRATARLTVTPPRAHRGDQVTVRLDVTPAVRRGAVHTALTLLGETTERTVTAGSGWQCTAVRRGHTQSGILVAERISPLWIARRRLTTSQPVPTTVLPRLGAFTAGSPHAWVDDDGAPSTKPGGPVFAGLREFVDGDDVRLVDWAASARTADESWVVRHRVHARTDAFRLLLDPDVVDVAEQALDRFETAVDVTYSIAHAVNQLTGHRAAIMTTIGGRAVAPAGIDAVGDALTRVQPCHESGCLARLLRQAAPRAGLTTVVVTTRPAAEVLTPTAGRLVLMRIGAATQAQQVGGATVYDVSDLAAAAHAWSDLVHR